MHRLLLTLVRAPTIASSAEITTLPVSALDWSTSPEGVAFAPIKGDRFKEQYMAMVSLPNGLVSPAHTKSEDMFGLIISGAMTHVPDGSDPKSGDLLTVGAFYHIPADVPHVSSCLSAEDCVTFLYQPGAFDFLPVAQ